MGWRTQMQTACINDPCLRYQYAIGIQEIDITAYLPLLIAIEKTVNNGLLVSHHIDQIICSFRQKQIYRIARIYIEYAKRIKAGIAAYSRGSYICDRTSYRQAGLRSAIGNNLLARLGNGDWRKDKLQCNRDDCNCLE